MSFTIEIKKAKIASGKKEKLELEFVKKYDTGEKNPGSEEFDSIPHPDLKQAFRNIRIHLALMAGMVALKDVKNIELPKDEIIDAFHVHGYGITGNEDDPGVYISGHVILSNKKAFNFTTPFYRINENEETRYKYMDDLMAKLDRLDTEIHAYVDGTKRGIDPQGNLFEGQPEAITNVKIAEPLTDGQPQEETPAAETEQPVIVDTTGQEGAGVIVNPADLLQHISENDKKD